jgi:hypothetical protein
MITTEVKQKLDKDMQTLEAQSEAQNPIVDICVLFAQVIENSQHCKGMVPPPNLKHIGEIP